MFIPYSQKWAPIFIKCGCSFENCSACVLKDLIVLLKMLVLGFQIFILLKEIIK